MSNKELKKVYQQVNLLRLQFKQELRLMQISHKRPEFTIKFLRMLIIKHGRNISRTLNSFLTMHNTMLKDMNVKASLHLIRRL